MMSSIHMHHGTGRPRAGFAAALVLALLVFAAVVLVTLLLGALTVAAADASYALGGGYDYYSGPGGEVTRSALAIGAIGAGGSVVTLAGLRFDDNLIGIGGGAILGLAVPAGPRATLRGWGSRFAGDQGYGAWRLKAGPQLAAPRDGTLGLYYAHDSYDGGPTSDGVVAEYAQPIVPMLGARAGAAWASASDGQNASQATVGLSVTPVRPLQITADAGFARNGSLLGAPVPQRGLLDRVPVIGGGPRQQESSAPSTTDATVLVSVRLLFP